jgi:hypothetical protein
MSEPSADITNQRNDAPQTTDITNEVPAANDDFPLERFRLPPVEKNKLWSRVVVAALVLCVFVVGAGLLIPSVERVREAAARTQSINNCKQMCLALNNLAGNTKTGDIPSSYGPFPPGAAGNQSFFVSLLPYIEAQDLYNDWPNKTNRPYKPYIAPADPNNPGTSGLISYGSNANLLTVGGSPTLPHSFCGRTSQTIVVFERTAKSGATWSSSNSYLIDTYGNSIPEFTDPASWTGYGSSATALTSAGCIVGMGDGSVRVVTQKNANAGWAWAMNPVDASGQPNGW